MARKKKESYAEKAKAAVQSLKQAGSTIKTDALRKTPESAKTRQIIRKDKETRTAKAEQRRQQTIKSAKKTTDALREQKRAKQAEARRQQTIKSARQTAKDVAKSKARASLSSVKQAAETAKSAVGGVLKAHEERKTATQPAKTMRETLKTIGGTAGAAHKAASGKGFAGKTGKMIDTAVRTSRKATGGASFAEKTAKTIGSVVQTARGLEKAEKKRQQTAQKNERERQEKAAKSKKAEEKRQHSAELQRILTDHSTKAKWADEIKAGTVFRTGAENMGKVAKKTAETIETVRGQQAKRQEDITSGAITPETVLEDMARRSNRWAILQNAKNTTGTNDAGKKQIRHLDTQQEELHRQNALDAAQFGLVFNPGSGKWEFGQDYEQAGQEVYDTSLHPSSPETVRTHFKNRIQQVPGDVVRQASDPGMLENFQQAHGGEVPKTPIMLPKTPQEIAAIRAANYEKGAQRAKLPLEVLGHNTAAGLAGIANAAYSTADFFLPDPITLKPVQDFIDEQKRKTSEIKEQVTAWDYEHGGKIGGFAGSTYQSFVEMLPQAVAALMTGGGSAAASLGDAGGAVAKSANKILKNPAYWMSFTQIVGNEYERKKNDGMSDLAAVASAIVSAAGQAGIEMSGGVETLAQGGANGLKAVGRTAFEEGREEVLQDVFSGLTDEGLYTGTRSGHYINGKPVLGTDGETSGKTIFGTGDSDALINPARMGSEFAAGALLGGIMSGVKILPTFEPGQNARQKMSEGLIPRLQQWDNITYDGMPGTVLRANEDGSAVIRVQDAKTGKYRNIETSPRVTREILQGKLFRDIGKSDFEQSSFAPLPLYDEKGNWINRNAQNAQPQADKPDTAQSVTLLPAFDEQGRRIDRNAQPGMANSQTLGQDSRTQAEVVGMREQTAERIATRDKVELAQQRQAARDAEIAGQWERINNHQIRRNAHLASGLKLHDHVMLDGYSGIVTEFTGDGKVSVQFYDVQSDSIFTRTFTPEEAVKMLQVKKAGQQPEAPQSSPMVQEITREEFTQKWIEDRAKDLRSEFTKNDEKAATLVLRGDDNAVTMADNPRLVREYCDIFPSVAQGQIDNVQARQAQTAAENAAQMQQGKEHMAQMAQPAPQQQAATEPAPSAPPAVGEKVRSAKMGNIGTIENVNEDGTYRIRFENKQTDTFVMRNMDASEFETIRQPPAPDAASREMAQNQMDALESDSYKQPEQDAIDAADHTLIREDSPNFETLRAWSDYRKAKAATERFLKSQQGQELTQHDKDIAKSIMLSGNEADAQLADHPRAALEYAMLQATERTMYKPISKQNAERMQALIEQANKDAETIEAFAKDKHGLQYQTETMERNFYDIFGKDHRAEAQDFIDRYVTPVHKAVAKGNKMRNEMRQRVKDLKLTQHESAIVQYLLENERGAALEYAKEHKIKIDDARQKKLDKAVETFRDIYNSLFAMINDVQIENGIEPTEFRKNYAPHFAEEMPDTRIARAFYLLGMKITNENNLPTDLAGITETFRPGHQWFGHLERRQGGKTVYDAVKGFDSYIETAVDVITLTESIQRIRALEDGVRYRLSDDGTQALVDNIRENRELDALERRKRIEEIYKDVKTGMPGLVTELRDWGNRLAGKKHRRDRGIEDDIGRDIYAISRQVQSRVAANMIALNPGSWLTNFIPLTQATGELGNIYMLRGMAETVKNYATKDGFADCSDFLVNRRGSDSIAKSTLRKMSDVAGAPMQWIDMFTAESIVRARTMQNRKNGMDFDAAVSEADTFAASIMADRSKGAMPSVFERQSPLVKPFTMFQLEVNNQLRYLGKDLPRRLGEKGVAAIAMALARIFGGAWLYNQAYSWLTGRDAALDPISMIQDALGGIGDPDDERTAGDRIRGLGKDILEEIPFVGGLAGGGRLPISAALPSIKNFTPKELIKPATYLLLPFGGGAIKKAAEGIATVHAGGAYGTDKDGRRQLLFPQYGQDFSDYALAALFGKYRTKEAQNYVKSGFQRLNADETAAYEYLIKDKQADKVIASPPKKVPPEVEPITTPRITSGLDPRQSYEAVKKLGADGAKDYKKLIECGISHETALDALQKLKEVKADWERKAPGEPGSGWDGLPEFEDKYIMSGEDEETVENTKKKDLEMRKNRVIMDLDISAADKALIKWVVGVDKPIDFSSEDAFAITSALAEKDQKDALALYHDDGFSAEQAIKYGGLVPDAVQDGEDSYNIKINAWDTIRNAKDLTDAQKNAAMDKIILPSLGAKWRSAAADKFIGNISGVQKAYFAIAMQQIDKAVDNDITISAADKKEYKRLRKEAFIQELGLPLEKNGEVIEEGMTFGQREMLTWFMSADNGDLNRTWADCINGESKNLSKAAPALQESGLDVDLYKVIVAGLNRFSGDKYSNGEPKPYSRRNKRVAYLDQWEALTTSQKVLIMQSIGDKYEYGSPKKSGKGKGKGGRKSGGGLKGGSAASGMMSGWQTMK